MKKTLTYLLAMLLLPMTGYAQHDNIAIWTSLAAEKKIGNKLTVGLEGERRTKENGLRDDRWSVGLYGGYKILPWLKASAGYTWLYDHHVKEKYNEDDELESEARFWSCRHRIHAALTGTLKVARFNISLRERWQYTYRPERTVDRTLYTWAYDDYGNVDTENTEIKTEPKTYRSKAKNVLRSRLQVEYNIRHCPVTPYISAEMSNAWNIQKVRYTAGFDWKLSKQHVIGMNYRFQKVYKDDEEPDTHIVGIGYKFKF